MNPTIKILETPRDAMQGLQRIIPTDHKVELINTLLQVGFDIIDVGSIVSEKAVPQMKDTLEVLDRINTAESSSKLFVLVVNSKGALSAAGINKVSYLGFPFSSSPTFLKKNINSDFDNAWKTINEIQNCCIKWNKNFLVYFSMAFGNPYGDTEDVEIIYEWTEKLYQIGIRNISLSDITGVANPEKIETIFHFLTNQYPEIEFGLHLHTRGNDPVQKLNAAFNNGCRLFESVINGLGGCPMTGYELLGNLPTGSIINWASSKKLNLNINYKKYLIALNTANKILY